MGSWVLPRTQSIVEALQEQHLTFKVDMDTEAMDSTHRLVGILQVPHCIPGGGKISIEKNVFFRALPE